MKNKTDEFAHCYQQDDLFVAEFPKSGVTWVTTILASLEESYCPTSNRGEFGRPVGWGIIPKYISDDSTQVALSQYRSKIFGGRIIKTHSLWREHHQRCIYLYRHPARVMASYWLMLKSYGQIDKEMELEKFCLHKDYGLPAWRAHIQSWLHKSSPGSVIFFLSYENLQADTIGSMQKVSDLFGSQPTKDRMEMAVKNSSREKMIDAESRVQNSDIRKVEKIKKSYHFVGSADRGVDNANRILPLVEEECKEEIACLFSNLGELK